MSEPTVGPSTDIELDKYVPGYLRRLRDETSSWEPTEECRVNAMRRTFYENYARHENGSRSFVRGFTDRDVNPDLILATFGWLTGVDKAVKQIKRDLKAIKKMLS